MTATLSDDTKAILLLTASFNAGSAEPRHLPLSLGDYKHLARKLRELGRKPADLIAPSANDLVAACGAVVEAARLRELLSRGFQMAQAVERWSARAIWVISRADESYPRRWKDRLKEDCPPILYGCGDVSLLARGGLAVVGSRNADDDTLAWARHVGTTSAEAGVAVVSGGARGIDDAAVRGSAARFNVGHAMGRNKLIHCLADASLVVRCDAGSGGTWSGAVEHLGREGATALYVKNGAEAPEGNRALLAKQAVPWPEPMSVDVLRQALDAPPLTKPKPTERSLFPDPPVEDAAGTDAGRTLTSVTDVVISPDIPASRLLYVAARPIILKLLLQPHGEKELATALGIPAVLAKTWLTTLMVENGVEKSGRPARYRLPDAAATLSNDTPDPNR